MKFLLICLSLLLALPTVAKQVSPEQVGAEQLALYLNKLEGKSVGLVVNQTSRAKGKHLVDLLVDNNVNVTSIFAPEHGFRGKHDAGEKVKSGVDAATGIKIVSIYGKNKKPTAEQFADLDVVIFDIQDVGVRFYTYISSMFYVMQAAAENNVKMYVLDRPNPNIQYVDGPMLDEQFRSFVGLLPIPLVHGMTVGEIALMTAGENWLNTIEAGDKTDRKIDLTVIPVTGYYRTDNYSLPVLPSPNLPNDQAIQLYPSLCFFEATPISIGRGTDFPFQVVGYSDVALGKFTFTPRSIKGAASNPKLKGVDLTGVDLRAAQISGLDLDVFYSWFKLFETNNLDFFSRASFMDKLAGTDQIRLDMLAGRSLVEIKAKWHKELIEFKKQRQPYLLYR